MTARSVPVALPAVLAVQGCTLRPWRAADRRSLLENANSPEISQNLWDSFPFPYEARDADLFLADYAEPKNKEGFWAIEVEGKAIGSISVTRGTDVERLSAEIGYWIGKCYWGRGVATAAVRLVTQASFDTDLVRLFAPVFAGNVRSMRVLEKVGYVREGLLRSSAIKAGVLIDRILFAKVKEDVARPGT